VKGALFEVTPERPSQIACGISHSRQNHGAWTLAKKGSFLTPVSHSVEGEKKSDDENEERVMLESCGGTEGGPLSPSTVLFLVAFLLL
jgi:hypothetical protein